MKEPSVFTFSKEERETIILYNYTTKTYDIESTSIDQIPLLMKRYPNHYEVLCVNDKGKPTQIRISNLPSNAITYRTVE